MKTLLEQGIVICKTTFCHRVEAWKEILLGVTSGSSIDSRADYLSTFLPCSHVTDNSLRGCILGVFVFIRAVKWAKGCLKFYMTIIVRCTTEISCVVILKTFLCATAFHRFPAEQLLRMFSCMYCSRSNKDIALMWGIVTKALLAYFLYRHYVLQLCA